MIFRWPALAAGLLLLAATAPGLPTTATPNNHTPVTNVNDATPSSSAPDAEDAASNKMNAPSKVLPAETMDTMDKREEEERPASVKQVLPPTAQGYRMPGLYGMDGQPFYLEKDPVTGAVDFSRRSDPIESSNHRYSAKVAQPADYDYEESVFDGEEDPIDRKDTLGSNRPNDIKQHDFTPYYQSSRDKTKEKFPLISSSYANTKVQGMGIVKPDPPKPAASTPSTPPPSYYSFKPSEKTTEAILDFWPVKSTTAVTPSHESSYDYYDENTNEEEVVDEVTNAPSTSLKPPTTPSESVVYSKPYVTPVPTQSSQEQQHSSTYKARPTTPKTTNNNNNYESTPQQNYQTTPPGSSNNYQTQQNYQPTPTNYISTPPNYVSQPPSRPYGYEEPFRPLYGPGEGEEEPIRRPSDYQQPPPENSRPQQRPPRPDQIRPQNFDNRPQNPDNRPQNYDNRPQNPENRPQNFDNRPQNPENRPQNFDNRPQNPDNRPQNFDNRPQKPDKRPQNFDRRPPLTENRPQNFDNRPQNFDNRPPPQENRPQNFDSRPPPQENRPQIYDSRPPPQENRPQNYDNRPQNFNQPPIPIYNQQPGQRRPPQQFIAPPSQRPPQRFEPPTRYEEETEDESEIELETSRPSGGPQIDSQGWKQATFTQSSPPPLQQTTQQVRFPDDDDTEETDEPINYTPARVSSPPPLRTPLPQGYEPQRPPPPSPFRPPPQQRRPPQDQQQQQRPPNQPPRRWENRPHQNPPQFYQPGLPPQSQQSGNAPKFGTRIKPQDPILTGGPVNKPSALTPDPSLPNILPQFRPNAKISHENEKTSFVPPRQRQPGFLERLQPPPPPPARLHRIQGPEETQSPPPQRFHPGPLVGRRVGPQVSTLQMMQQGSLPRPASREDAPHPHPRPPVTPYEVRPSKYGSLQQGSEERPVFVVYPAGPGDVHTSAPVITGDVHVGTQGSQRPLPPSHLTEEEPVLHKRPSTPIKVDFPYALEKPTEKPILINTDNEEINIIPNLQDFMPFATKRPSSTINPTSPTTPFRITDFPIETARPTIQPQVIRPAQSNSEFTVSAVMHTGGKPVIGQGSVMVVAPQHRDTSSNAPPSSSSPAAFNFQAPFHASANVAPSPGNGWSAVRNSGTTEDTMKPGLVDRADVDVTEKPVLSASNKFDIENFQPELIGGFKPIYSFPEEPAKTEEKPGKSAEREERKLI